MLTATADPVVGKVAKLGLGFERKKREGKQDWEQCHSPGSKSLLSPVSSV